MLFTYLAFTSTLFVIGLEGIILRQYSVLVVLMSIELRLLSVNMNFIYFGVLYDDLVGLVFSLFVLTVAAAESAIGLAILVVYHRVRNTISLEKNIVLQG